jgi:CRISPR-associated protein Csx17
MMPEIALTGCAAQPLASYLRGLAVFRLVSEQADSEARGWWGRDCFHLESRFDADQLTAFFLNEYRPTPIIAPWNGGSGFYPKDRKDGIDAIAESTDARFAIYRGAIDFARNIPLVLKGEKFDSKADEEERRASILRDCRNGLPDEAVAWLDAAISISADGNRGFAPILGTGGNEGRLDYTNNFMGCVSALLALPSRPLLLNALFGFDCDGFQPAAVGQYDPGRAGGFNQGSEIETKDIPSNPWNFVLALEGAIAWAAGIYRKQSISFRSFLCSPFTVYPSAVGFGSAGDKDQTTARAEIWMPIWDRPCIYAEIKTLLREGRASVDGKPAENALEFAQAACSLGTDRGIRSFVRYSLLKRRGDSFIALPAGNFAVEYRSETDLVRQIVPLLEISDRLIGKQPGEYVSLRRQIDESIYSLLSRGGSDAVSDVVKVLGRLHRWLLLSNREIQLPARLDPRWLEACGSESEVRIAAALASITGPSIYENIAQSSRDFAWTGGGLTERIAAVLQRRVLRAKETDRERNPVYGRYRASPADVARFLRGDVRDDLIEDLFFAFTLIDWRGDVLPNSQMQIGRNDVDVYPAYTVLKHIFWPGPLTNQAGQDVFLASDLRILGLLVAGDVGTATQLAIRRLHVAGFAPIEVNYEDGPERSRLSAAMLVPIPAAEFRYLQRAVLWQNPVRLTE